MTAAEIKELLESAFIARENAYAPYSGVSVGAALLTSDGHIFVGCNIENSAYSPSICAERVAVSHAVSAGYRNFAALAVCGGAAEKDADAVSFFPPCGVCRQFLAEFCAPDFPIYIAIGSDNYQELRLADSLPHSFGQKNMA